MGTIIIYKISDAENIKGYWNGKNYGGKIYINPEQDGEIIWTRSIKVRFDKTRISELNDNNQGDIEEEEWGNPDEILKEMKKFYGLMIFIRMWGMTNSTLNQN